MFVNDRTTTNSILKEKNFVKVLFSMNNHDVATPEMNVEEARSYVFFFREGQVRRSAYIGIHLLPSDRKLFYTYTSNPFPEENMLDVEDEARSFAEDLGAMLDEIDFTYLPDEERERWIDAQSIFTQKKQPEAEQAVTSSPDGEPPRQEAAAPGVQPLPAAVPITPITPVQPVSAPAAVVPETSVPSVQPTSVAKPAPVQEPPVAPVQPVVISRAPEVAAPAAPEPPLPLEPKQRAMPQAAAIQKRQEIMQKAIKAVRGKNLKQSLKKEPASSRGVVSRDREALARLLTSF